MRKEIKEVEQDIVELLSTYNPDRGRFRPEMTSIYQTLGYLRGLLAQILRDSNACGKIAEAHHLVLGSIGVVVVDKSISSSSNRTSLPVSTPPRINLDYAVSSAIQLAILHKNLGRDEMLARRWLKAGMWMHDVGWEEGGNCSRRETESRWRCGG